MRGAFYKFFGEGRVYLTRLFYGLELPQEWKDALRALQTALKAKHVQANAWNNPDLLHMTVLFLGQMEDASLTNVVTAGEKAVQGCRPFQLTTGSLGQFSRNKVFWLGLDKQHSDWQALNHLHEQVKAAVLAQLPLDLDEKRYRPHITLARKLQQRVDVERLALPAPLTATFTDLCLFESTRIDGQLCYPIRHRFTFTSHADEEMPMKW